MAKMWAGRFQKETDAVVNDFNSSVMFDCRMYAEDIQGSIAHATMLGRQGIIPQDDVHKIIEGLQGILTDIEAGKIHFSPELYEDIHMANEQLLTERIGDAGKRLHTARSRNDQVALDMRLYVRREIKEIRALVLDFMHALCEVAAKHTETVMPGYTHLQRAQPITFAHHLMAYANMLKRDVRRLDDCLSGMDALPLGSGALAGTTYPIDRAFVAEQLGFSAVMDNSLDGVSDRDYCIELCADLSILMMHLSRLSEEVIAWCSWEFKFIELDDAYSTGSSIMPQKKNPDICELIRGKTGRVYGALTTLLTFMKAIPLAYNKDMQEDKEATFDAIDTVKNCLRVIAPMFRTMTVLTENMKNAAKRGFINATDCADYLTKKGMPFRDAYKATGTLVHYCIEHNKTLDTLSLDEYKAVTPMFEDDVYHAIDLSTCVRERRSIGGPAPDEVARQLKVIEDFLAAQGGEN
ncbi:argininosuccinate lyase [Butyricicoccus pullicaecorum]|uniref:Argininosuccinate lyase n=1 Tax=Butyricicoccus pullicaecorum TaxID=501571 RepID=A0A1Y4LP36_9FIRM|nr:argininosuccinate lyase [Butyricicoccus pullicaecorum]OUP58444.1 argininosuccinate lyase [Butyricicoccus pullicaecorum]